MSSYLSSYNNSITSMFPSTNDLGGNSAKYVSNKVGGKSKKRKGGKRTHKKKGGKRSRKNKK